ncbi:neuronal acetylcholine receptor subunit alpha-6-like [Patiria miniata]|uniref:Uncharacterized protein n=1 Tax=Patiria miniata TaxID=46514 RepID=A0A914B664_PATMI|nr:neuronal acetylcholine receptor subunit alpha-6-like [Patiria miniata]
MAFRSGVLMVVLGLCLLYLNGSVGVSSAGLKDPVHDSRATLIVHLLSLYHPMIIPMTPVNVSYGLELLSIDGVDEKENILRFSAWSRIQWRDHRFQWDPIEYNGVNAINLPGHKVWRPDLRLYAQVLEEEDVNLRAYSDGTIYHLVPMRLAVPCSMQFANYPFDVQTCDLRLESWTYDGTMINLSLFGGSSGASVGDFHRPNSQWKVQSFTASRQLLSYVCCVEKYINLSFRIQVQRQVGEYTVRVLAPSVVTSLLILLCFLIPPHCGERILLCSVLLLCVLLQLFHLNLTVPISGPDAPFLANFLCFSVFLAFFAAVESVLSLNLSRCGSGSGNNNGRLVDGEPEEFVMQAKPNTSLKRVARFIDVGCFIVFTFIFAVAGGVILNPKTE